MPKPRPAPPPPIDPLSRRLLRAARAFAWSLASWVAPVLLPMLALLAILCCVLRLDQSARADLAGLERYRISFTTVDCETPQGLDKDEFLSEVQYLARQPDDVHLLDDETATRLAAAFAQHPWVEQVRKVTMGPNRVHVSLQFRTATLAVHYGGRLRAVDANGILLPASATTEGLPVYRGIAEAPKGPAGTPWGDPALAAAASHPTQP